MMTLVIKVHITPASQLVSKIIDPVDGSFEKFGNYKNSLRDDTQKRTLSFEIISGN